MNHGTDQSIRHPNLAVLGCASFFSQLASHIVFPLLPLFLTTVLGLDKTLIGLVEGMAVGLGHLAKFLSSWLADRVGRYKALVGLGDSLAGAGLLLLAMAGGPWQVLLFRCTERLGTGIGSTPRDSLVAASSAIESMSASFATQRAMERYGAILGPACAVGLLMLLQGDYRAVFFVAALVGLTALGLTATKAVSLEGPPIGVLPFISWKALEGRFKLLLIANAVFAAASTSYIFFLLRAHDLGIPAISVPLLYMVSLAVCALVPASNLGRRMGSPVLIFGAYVGFAGLCFGFGTVGAPWQIWALFAGLGLCAGIVDSVQRTWMPSLLSIHLRASGLALNQLLTGLAALPACFLTGYIWDRFGAPAAFIANGALALAAAVLLGVSLLIREHIPAVLTREW